MKKRIGTLGTDLSPDYLARNMLINDIEEFLYFNTVNNKAV